MARPAATKEPDTSTCNAFSLKIKLNKGVVQVQCCPTEQMDADFMSKATQGETCHKFCKCIVGVQ